MTHATLATIAAAGVLVAGCTGMPARSEGTGVIIQTFQFRPGVIRVPSGSRVTWTNLDDIEHIVASGTPGAKDGRFVERLRGKGTTASVTFDRSGTYPYFCDRHPEMQGQIWVN